MKYISVSTVKRSLESLVSIDMFFGTTFLVFKRDRLPVGRTIDYPINLKDREFMDRHYRINLTSNYYYRPFRLSDKNKYWLENKYPESGLQSARTRKFGKAFIHESGTSAWGWENDYVSILESLLYRNEKISLFHLACWIMKYESFNQTDGVVEVLNKFTELYNITQDEIRSLFYLDEELRIEFSDEPLTWRDFSQFITPPPDQEGTMDSNISFFQLDSIGGIKSIKMEPAERLNICAGDNSVGKTLLMDSLFWSVSGVWPNYPADPNLVSPILPKFVWQIGYNKGEFEFQALFDAKESNWQTSPELKGYDGRVLYFRSDSSVMLMNISSKGTINVSTNDLMHGYAQENRKFVLNGVILDIADWFNRKDHRIRTFNIILQTLSPSDARQMRITKVGAVASDSRPMPFLRLPYDTVPLHQLSAGVKKVVSLAYVMTLTILKIRESETLDDQIVFIMDEIEAHLHPNWQRVILPSIVRAFSNIIPLTKIQYFISTHSAIVTTSIEPYFDVESDKLFHFNMGKYESGSEYSTVRVTETPFDIKGKAETWYTSEYFGLKSTRSIEGEAAVEAAVRMMNSPVPDKDIVAKIGEDLSRLVGFDDSFWPKWLAFESKLGVER